MIEVAAGVLRDAAGRVLVAERPAGKPLAGAWEFPGGKIEAGESPASALRRELAEELALTVGDCRPLIQVPSEGLRLHVLEVLDWHGEPRPQEGQRIRWLLPDALDALPMPAPDRPAVTALRLPPVQVITPALPPRREPELREAIGAALGAGTTLLQLRLPGWSRDRLAALARAARQAALARRAHVLVYRDWQLAGVLGVGVQLPAAELRELGRRPLPPGLLVGVDCRSGADLTLARELGADFANLQPVLPSGRFPGASPLGWAVFEQHVRAAGLPVYADGGTGDVAPALARARGGQGITAVLEVGQPG